MYPNNLKLMTNWYRVSMGEEIENSNIFFRFIMLKSLSLTPIRLVTIVKICTAFVRRCIRIVNNFNLF